MGQEEEEGERDELRALFPVYDDHFVLAEDDLPMDSDKEMMAGKSLPFMVITDSIRRHAYNCMVIFQKKYFLGVKTVVTRLPVS